MPLTPSWLPDGALIYADFVNARYWADGAEKTVSDIVIENTDWLTFNPATDITIGGLVFGGPVINPLYMDDLLSSFSFVQEFFISNDTIIPTHEVLDLPGYNDEQAFMFSTGPFGGTRVRDRDANDGTPLIAAAPNATQKGGGTLTSGKLAICVGGGTINQLVPVSVSTPPTHFALGLVQEEAKYRIRTLAIYAALSDAQLQALTA